MIFLQTFDELRNFLFQFPKLGLSWPNEPWFIFLFSVKEIKKKKVDNIFVQISLTGFQQPKILWFEFKKSLEDVFGRSKQKAFCIQHLVLTFLSRNKVLPDNLTLHWCKLYLKSYRKVLEKCSFHSGHPDHFLLLYKFNNRKFWNTKLNLKFFVELELPK